MSRFLKMCLRCESGNHGRCLIHNCQCPVKACVISRQDSNRMMVRKGYLPPVFEKGLLKRVRNSDGK